MASASPLDSAVSCEALCSSDEDCGGGCYCVPDPDAVSSLLLRAHFKLTCNHFTGGGGRALQKLGDFSGMNIKVRTAGNLNALLSQS
jgi:hypothetical protein